MNPNRIRVGQRWRTSDGRTVEVVFVQPDKQLNVGVQVRNVDTGKLTWCTAWRISAYWRLVQDVQEVA